MNGAPKSKLKTILTCAALIVAVTATGVVALAQPAAPPKPAAPPAPTAVMADGPADAPAVATAAPTPAPVVVPVNLTLAPATTYATSCIKCHGVDGVKRSSGAWFQTTNKRLAIVTGMMRGKAKLTPSIADVEAMASYVQSLRGGSFAAIVNGADFASGKSPSLQGDATAGAKVTLIKDGKETPITLTKSAWSLDAPPKAPFTIKAVNGDQIAQFNFPEKQWAFAANPANKVAPPARPAMGGPGMHQPDGDKPAMDKPAAPPTKG